MRRHEMQQLNIFLNIWIIEYCSFWKIRVLHEPIGGANSSAPHRVTLTLLLDNYLSRSFSSARTQKNLLLKNVLLIEAPWRRW
jgi:hypothetical protein